MILAMEFVATFCTVDAGVSLVLLLYSAYSDEHARACKHPVIASAEIGERWLYCYPDEQVAEY